MEPKNPFQIRSEIKKNREDKIIAKEKNFRLNARLPFTYEPFQKEMFIILEDLITKNSKWIEEEKEKFTELFKDVSDQDVLAVYTDGIRVFFKQEFKLLGGSKSEFPEELREKSYIESKIKAYTFDFIQSLKKSQKLELTSTQALELARLSYRHNPDFINSLKNKYPEVDHRVIMMGSINYPTRTDEFIKEYISNVEKLKKEFPEVLETIIKEAAASYSKNPELFIKKYLTSLEELSQKYPDIDRSLLSIVSTFPDPEKSLKAKLLKIDELKQVFPEVDLGVIKVAAIGYTDSQEFIYKYLENIKLLQKKYPELDISVIKTATTKYANAPEKFIEGYKERITELLIKYPELDEATIRYIALGYTTTAGQFINKYINNTKIFLTRYPEVDPSIIKKITLHNPSDPDKKIESYISNLAALKSKNPNLDQRTLNLAALSKNPELYIEKISKLTKELSEKYPDLGLTVIKLAALDSDSPFEFIETYIRKTNELTQKYKGQEIDPDIITKAVLNYTDPDKYITNYIKSVKELSTKHPKVSLGYIKRAVRNNPTDPEKYLKENVLKE